ncbi:hypothetical protein M8C21_015437 [Ambrosia artemisiifolia]|uniref:Uncharacterized protein n=1 Tax=Ambrosia artemisiifolia TaxID=4212 RepID=A0AAD5C455_AMBAR|nr:hypothetical protein M8C21_015437 [Ambrosia artemisiifolia]
MEEPEEGAEAHIIVSLDVLPTRYGPKTFRVDPYGDVVYFILLGMLSVSCFAQVRSDFISNETIGCLWHCVSAIGAQSFAFDQDVEAKLGK